MRKDIDKLVLNLMKKANSRNPYILSDFLDIEIIPHNLGKALGMYQLINRNKFIFINEGLDDTTRRFVVAHELGHAILHRTSSGFYFSHYTRMDTTVYEKEANIFASELLIDNSDIKERIYYGMTISQLSSYFEVPEELIQFKIHNLKTTGKEWIPDYE